MAYKTAIAAPIKSSSKRIAALVLSFELSVIAPLRPMQSIKLGTPNNKPAIAGARPYHRASLAAAVKAAA
jgi:hypothetical protein